MLHTVLSIYIYFIFSIYVVFYFLLLFFVCWFCFVIFGGRVFQQTVGIPMGTKCAPLLADLFLYLYKQTSYRGFYRKPKRS